MSIERLISRDFYYGLMVSPIMCRYGLRNEPAGRLFFKTDLNWEFRIHAGQKKPG